MSHKRYKREMLIEKIEWIELYSNIFGGCRYKYPKIAFQFTLDSINNIESHEHEEVGKFLEVYDEKTKTTGSIYISQNT
jgi:hypothetical protein